MHYFERGLRGGCGGQRSAARACRSRPHRVTGTPSAHPSGLDCRAWLRRARGGCRREHHPGCDRDRIPSATALNTARPTAAPATSTRKSTSCASRYGSGPWIASIAPPSTRSERECEHHSPSVRGPSRERDPQHEAQHRVDGKVRGRRERCVVAAGHGGHGALRRDHAAHEDGGGPDRGRHPPAQRPRHAPVMGAKISSSASTAAATTPRCTVIRAAPSVATWLPMPRQASAGSTPRSSG